MPWAAAWCKTLFRILRSDPSFLGDVSAFSKNYEAPGFTKKTLIKFKAFLDAKLPR